MQDSIFTKIIKGEIPCHKVYEDDKTLAFLDIHPITAGHTLIVPKQQVEFVWDLEQSDYEALMATVLKVAKRLKSELGSSYVGEMVVGTDVPHAHVHLVGFNETREIHEVLKTRELEEPDHAALAQMAEKLHFS